MTVGRTPIPLPFSKELSFVSDIPHWETIHRMTVGRTSPHLIPTIPESFVILGGFNQESATEVKTPQLYSMRKVVRGIKFSQEQNVRELPTKALAGSSGL